MRLIDKDALYERLKADEELARDRVIDTPNSFPNGMLNPAAVRYQAQLSERTRLKEIVHDAPTIEERKTGEWIPFDIPWYQCSECGAVRENTSFMANFCPYCGADMRGGNHE